MNSYAKINALRAIAGGWTNITPVNDAHGTLLGEPPDGAKNSRGQALVPDYCGDWRHAGLALSAYTGSSVWTDQAYAYAKLQDCENTVALRELIADHPTLDTAIKTAIIRAETAIMNARVPLAIRRAEAARRATERATTP